MAPRVDTRCETNLQGRQAMITTVKGHRRDGDNEISLTPQDALQLAKDLIEAHEESGHHGAFDVSVHSMANTRQVMVFRVDTEL